MSKASNMNRMLSIMFMTFAIAGLTLKIDSPLAGALMICGVLCGCTADILKALGK